MAIYESQFRKETNRDEAEDGMEIVTPDFDYPDQEISEESFRKLMSEVSDDQKTDKKLTCNSPDEIDDDDSDLDELLEDFDEEDFDTDFNADLELDDDDWDDDEDDEEEDDDCQTA